MGNIQYNQLRSISLLKKHGFSDKDLLNLLGISKNAIETNNMNEKEIKSLQLLEAILTKEGLLT